MPIYDHLVAELLIDPDGLCREIDEWLIRWHATRQKEGHS